MTDPITWPTAVAIIGGLAVGAVTIMGFVIQTFKKGWCEPVINLDLRITRIETDLKNLPQRIATTQQISDDHDVRMEKDLIRLEIKMEKITDLMIKMLTEAKGSSDIE